MDIRKVKKLIELLEESGIAEIEISEGEESVRISRYPPGGVAPVSIAPAPAIAAAPSAEPAAAPGEPAADPIGKGTHVEAPMVGTYYSAANPGAKPFVEVGSTVNPGDTLCIIEAMKMMNQIEAEVGGRISSVLVSNGDPVEFGQVLFTIE
ncbi:MAG: acetyl-CoA carboxylase biotin carboxyl carrier protein [Gammaproteobacteria bacterium]|nr:acetyl-CoA carboxylase biotin carboxyl carrier protein [Gammaproteobacteria bacterium]